MTTPQAPFIYVRPKVSSNTIRFDWRSPTDGIPVSSYTLNGGAGQNYPNIPATSRAFVVRNLTNGVRYSFTLVARNNSAASTPSAYNPVYVGPIPPPLTTAVAIPTGTSTAVIRNCYTEGLDSYHISWVSAKVKFLAGSGSRPDARSINGSQFGQTTILITDNWPGISNRLNLVNNMYSFDVCNVNDSGYSVPVETNPIGNVQYNISSPSKLYSYTGSSFRSVASSSDEMKMVACATGPGSIWTTTDGGLNWVERTSAGSRSWLSIASSADGVILVACDQGGSLWTSFDSGVNWTERPAAGSRSWQVVATSANGTYMAAAVGGCNGGYVYTSNDSGRTWTEQTISGLNPWSSLVISNDGKTLYAGTSNGFIYRSTSFGVDWSVSNSLVSNWSCIRLSADKTTIIATAQGAESSIHLLSDPCGSWTTLPAAGRRNWTSVAVSADFTKIAATTYGGLIYYSKDSGVTWEQGAFTGTQNWRSITGDSTGQYLTAVVSNGSIWFSRNYGEQWYTYAHPGSAAWDGVGISQDGSIMITGGPTPWISNNGGVDWRYFNIFTNGKTQYNFSAFISTDNTFIAIAVNMSNSNIWTSDDSGYTWVKQEESEPRNWTSLSGSYDGKFLLGSEYNGRLYKSTNHGETWVALPFFTAPKYWSGVASDSLGVNLAAIDGANGSGFIWTSRDSGVTWVNQTGPDAEAWSSIASDSTGMYLVACVNGGSIWTSADYGETWTEQTITGPRAWATVTCSTYGNNIVAGVAGSGSLWTSCDFGVTWNAQVGTTGGNWVSAAVSANSLALIATNAGYNGNGPIIIGKID